MVWWRSSRTRRRRRRFFSRSQSIAWVFRRSRERLARGRRTAPGSLCQSHSWLPFALRAALSKARTNTLLNSFSIRVHIFWKIINRLIDLVGFCFIVLNILYECALWVNSFAVSYRAYARWASGDLFWIACWDPVPIACVHAPVTLFNLKYLVKKECLDRPI